jgi:hypothetical protein
MDQLWAPLLTFALFGVSLGGLVWLASRVRRHGIGGGVLSPFQDMYDPAAYRSQLETQIVHERKAPSPSADDPPWPS